MKTEIIPFTPEMIPAAGELLAKRHGHNRERLPVLPERFENPGLAAKAVAALLGKKAASGYSAIRNGKLVA